MRYLLVLSVLFWAVACEEPESTPWWVQEPPEIGEVLPHPFMINGELAFAGDWNPAECKDGFGLLRIGVQPSPHHDYTTIEIECGRIE